MNAPNPSPTFIPLSPTITPSPSSFTLLPEHRQLLELFSQLFEYPTTDRVPLVERMIRISNEISPKISRILMHYKKRIESLPLTRVQEYYSGLIDMNPHFHPYVASHILGESYLRSTFLVKLREIFREHHHEPPSNELPDHLAVLLKFISSVDDTEVARALLEDLVLPVLNKIVKEDNLAVENALMGTDPIQNPHVYLFVTLKEFVTDLLTSHEQDQKQEMKESTVTWK